MCQQNFHKSLKSSTIFCQNMTKSTQNCRYQETVMNDHPLKRIIQLEKNAATNSQYHKRETIEINPVPDEILEENVCKTLSLTGVNVTLLRILSCFSNIWILILVDLFCACFASLSFLWNLKISGEFYG